MDLFDLHCDTITVCDEKQCSLRDSDCHITLNKAAELSRWTQFFAIWMPDEYRGDAAIAYFDRIYQTFLRQMRKNADRVTQCRTTDEMEAAWRDRKCAAVLTVEGGSALAGDLTRVQTLYDCGVKLITLTWNAENELAYGCREDSAKGLKPFGKAALREMARLGITADVSHLNRAGFFDALEATDGPLIASHSNAAVLLKRRAASEDRDKSIIRNLEDDQIKCLIERDALIGLNFCKSFLGDPGDDGMDALLRNIWHILELGGERVLALGSDFDGCDVHPSLAGIDKMQDLYGFLQTHGVDDATLHAIFFENAHRFFQRAMIER